MIGWVSGSDKRREFEEVALVHLDALYRSALRLTRNRAEAEDLVQETCLRAFRNFHRFDPLSHCRVWLFTIMRNLFLNRLRQAGREVLEGDASALEALQERLMTPTSVARNPEEEFFQKLLHDDIDRALKALPLAFREAVILADLEGLSYKEVAEVLGCPTGTVMSRLSRGRQLLRHLLSRFAREYGYLRESE